jgi:hypothetical protein
MVEGSNHAVRMTPAARAIYLELATLYNGRNNGRLYLSVRDAASRTNVAKDTAGKAFKLLTANGFIECASLGAFSRKDPHASEWRLCAHSCDRTNSPASKAFMRWRPLEELSGGPKPSQCGPNRSPLNGLDIENVQ